MILNILHVFQWLFTFISVPLLCFLIYSIFKEWLVRPMPTLEAEYQRGYHDGYADGYDAARQDIALARMHECSMTGSDGPDSPESQ